MFVHYSYPSGKIDNIFTYYPLEWIGDMSMPCPIFAIWLYPVWEILLKIPHVLQCS